MNMRLTTEASKYIKSHSLFDIVEDIELSIAEFTNTKFVLKHDIDPEMGREELLLTAVESDIPYMKLNFMLINAVANVSAKAQLERDVTVIPMVELRTKKKASGKKKT